MNATSRRLATLGLALVACVPGTQDSADFALHELPAVDLVLGAFDDYPVVALSDGAGHGQLDTLDFFRTLIRDTRFQGTVKNIVIEFGNARHQDVMDRYISGEPIVRDELRHVWEDTTQTSGIWSLPMYEQMLAEVRSVNAALPSVHRIRVLLGDPPIDWSSISSPADEDMNDWRDAHVAHVVEREVLRRHERALILMGGAHIGRKVVLPSSLIHLLDARFPGRTWVVGVLDVGRVAPDVRARLQGWTLPAGVAIRDTWLGALDTEQIGFTLSTGIVQDDVDALLVLTAASPVPAPPATLDPTYARELVRRQALGEATTAFRGAKIRFDENRAVFASGSEGPLLTVLQELRRDPRLRLLVKAFADPGEPAAMTLSERRAARVVEWLVTRGVEPKRLVPRGCGTLRPLDFGTTPAGRSMNRRVELVRLSATAGCEPPW